MTLAIAATVGAGTAIWTTSRGVPASLFLLPLIASLAWTTVVSWPSIVAWAGPSAILPFALLAVGIVVSMCTARRDAAWLRLLTQHVDSRWSPCIAGTATALWLIALLTAATSLPVTGDEPHYLLVTQSLLADGDFDLTNNYDAESYRSFYAGPLQRHVTLGYLAQQYSFHGPALSILLIPGLSLGGVIGARLLIILLTAAGAGFFWSAARRLTGSGPAAWAGWVAMVSAAPFALHGILLYPDGIAAAVTSFATWVLVAIVLGRAPRDLAVVGSGLVLATLPWFHIRLSLSAGVFGLAMVWALGQRRRDLILPFLAAPIISFVLWMASTWVMFGTLDPTAAFREKAAGSLAQVPAGTLGLLFDVEYGLVTYAPALIFSVLGLVAMWQRSRVVAVVCLALTLATLQLAAAWIWWGGDSAPARFLVPVVPLLCLCVAVWWADATSRARSFTAVTIAVGAWVTACLAFAERGGYMLNVADSRGTIWEWLSPNVDLSLALPSLFRSGAQPGTEAFVAASWTVTGAVAFALTLYWRRTSAETTRSSWLTASTATIVWLTIGASVALLQREAPPWTPDRGQLRMLYAATSPALSRGVHGPAWHEINGRAAPAHFTTRDSALSSLSIATPAGHGTPTRLHVPFVPAGRYTIDVERPASAIDEPPPRLSLELGRDAVPFTRWFATSTASAPTFSLAVPIWSVRVAADSAGAPMRTVRLQPQVVTAPPPLVDGYALRATRYGNFVVYSMDPYSYVESNGFGLAADRQGRVIITDIEGRPAPYVLDVESGPVTATVTFERGAFKGAVSVMPGISERVSVPEEPGPVAPLRFTVSGGSWSRDGRRLGAFVRVSTQ